MKTNPIHEFAKSCVKRVKAQFFDPERKKSKIQAKSLYSVVKTSKFGKMAMHEKITAVARMLSKFEKDYGYAPVLLTQTLLELNAELNSSIIQIFS